MVLKLGLHLGIHELRITMHVKWQSLKGVNWPAGQCMDEPLDQMKHMTQGDHVGITHNQVYINYSEDGLDKDLNQLTEYS